jgi:hypothetical protein
MRFIGGTIIEITDELVEKSRLGMTKFARIANKAEVVFLLNGEVYTTDFEKFIAFIKEQEKKDW